MEVTSRWIHVDRPEEPTPEFFRAHGTERAVADVMDVHRADWLVLDLLDGYSRRGGMMFEAGLAMGMGKRVMLVGSADCVFTQLLERHDDWDSLINYFRSLEYLRHEVGKMYTECDVCARQSGVHEIGRCLFPQPNGRACIGTMRSL